MNICIAKSQAESEHNHKSNHRVEKETYCKPLKFEVVYYTGLFQQYNFFLFMSYLMSVIMMYVILILEIKKLRSL